jgi:hypothetical protein
VIFQGFTPATPLRYSLTDEPVDQISLLEAVYKEMMCSLFLLRLHPLLVFDSLDHIDLIHFILNRYSTLSFRSYSSLSLSFSPGDHQSRSYPSKMSSMMNYSLSNQSSNSDEDAVYSTQMTPFTPLSSISSQDVSPWGSGTLSNPPMPTFDVSLLRRRLPEIDSLLTFSLRPRSCTQMAPMPSIFRTRMGPYITLRCRHSM